VMAAKFLRYSLPILVICDLMAAVGLVAALMWLAQRLTNGVRSAVLTIGAAALAIVLFAGQVQTSPFFSFHRTTLARWLDSDGRRFPESTYDFGVREAVSQIAAAALPGATIVTDVPEVVRFYLDRGSRGDLQITSFSAAGLSADATEQWVLVQDAHVYFETRELVALLRMRHAPAAEYRINDITALQLFRIPKGGL